jgi:ElaB/YqjD/DUF883 family membrane-anchored ribosome-binding protein
LRGKAIWILSFFSFLSGLNAITAVVLSINLGIESTFQPYLISNLTGAIPTYIYLVASILATLVFLLATSSKVVNELSNIDLLNEINAKTNALEDGQTLQQSILKSVKGSVFLLHQNIDTAKKEISNNFSEQEEQIKKVHSNMVKMFENESADIKDQIGKQLQEVFSEQEEMLKQFHSSLTNKFESETTNIKDQIGKQLQELENTLQERGKTAKKYIKDLTKQKKEIAVIKEKITQLEEQFVKPTSQLTSQSSPEEVRGIGPNTMDELREMGITNVGELILADPKTIEEKTSTSEKMAVKLQGIAQLSMVPGVKEKDMILLEEIGITNRQELANQDAIEIGRKINKSLKAQIESGKILETTKPTIEEIQSWIRNAKT